MLVRTDLLPLRHSNAPPGLSPADIQSAYNLPSSNHGLGQIVAIVDVGDDANVASDLGVYRSTYGLPKGHFAKFNQRGERSNYPPDQYWGGEIALDVEMVSAACPHCRIYLVEASSDLAKDMEAAEVEAVRLGAHIISNSYGAGGLSVSSYNSPGVVYVASAGDSGYYSMAPAAFGSVVSVGGTSLERGGGGSRRWTETVWDGTSGGCSTEPKPSWQHDPGCRYRTGNDVAAVADPNTGVAVYSTDTNGAPPPGGPGWIVAGGTSASSPLIAGVFGLAANAARQHGGRTFWEKQHQSSKDLFKITVGNDWLGSGFCSPPYLCAAGTGEYKSYSGPGGWGTPNGIGSF